MRSEEGTIVEVVGEMARIKVGRHSECQSCGACPGNDSAIIDVRNPVGAAPGQRVIFESEETNALKGAFVVFVLPIAALLAGALIGGLLGEISGRTPLGGVVGGLLAFALACLFVKFFDRAASKDERSLARIVRVIK